MPSRFFHLRWLIPPDLWSWGLFVTALTPATIIYIVRANTDEFIMDAGLGLFFIMPMLLFGLFLFIVFCWALIWQILSNIRRTRGHALPLLAIIGAMILSFVAPLPPSAIAWEFAAHRIDYEAVVSLAQQHKLPDHPRCIYGLELPPTYQHLSRSCIQAIQQPALAIVFNPPTTHRQIIYAESLEALRTLAECCLNGSVYKRVDQHWFFFTPAQD